MSERIRGSYDDALYKSTFTLLYFTLYSAAYAMTGPARRTISEVAVDWQEPMVLQRKLRPSGYTITITQLCVHCAAMQAVKATV